MKKAVIISSSLRVKSNSEILAKECARGVTDSGNEAELIELKGKNIQYCRGCLACQSNHKCVIKDDVAEIMTKVKNADVVIFATPIYYYEMSGQLKTLLDRMNPMYGTDYRFTDVYMIATAADNGETTFDRAYAGLGGWVDCFENATLKGIVKGFGINDPGEAAAYPDKLKEAYELGKRA